MRLLVTGGAGYIGSVVAQRLVDVGHDVTVVDNLSMGWAEAVPETARFVRANIGDWGQMDALFGDSAFEAVLHFAAFIEAGESMKVPEKYFENNSSGTLTLLRAMLKFDVKRFVFSSTAAVYGQPRSIPVVEDHPLAPTNAYGASKLIVEQMLAWLNLAHGFRYASLRYFNAAGATPGRGEAHRSESHLIPLVLQVPLGQRQAISVYGTDYPTQDGTCIRDYIHIDDLASAHLLALNGLADHSQLICNLGSGTGFSVRQVIDIARRVTGSDIPVVECDRRPGDPAVLIASSQKIRDLLGWKPQYDDVEAIVRSAWEWHRSHPHGYDSTSR